MDVVIQIEHELGTKLACEALGVPRATYYRHWRTERPHPKPRRPPPPRALSRAEREQVLEQLHSERFVDKSPHEIYATLLDEQTRLCSVRTMYRLLEQATEARERRDQCRRPTFAAPELLATRPNQVWSWDITKLRTREKWSYFYLYVLMDIYSRCVVGWMLARRESGELAAELVRQTYDKQGVKPGQVTIHADRGSAPASRTLAQLYVDLGIERSHSRPQVSNDNPFSEAQFRTMKYRPDYPDRFGSFEDGLAFCRRFFDWYNTEHHHSGIAYLSPHAVHHGLADAMLAERQRALDAAYAAHPERFVRGRPRVPKLPEAVWINPPADRGQRELALA
jgi:putative transposase